MLAYLIHELPFAPFSVRGADGLSVRHPLSAAILAILAGLIARNLVALPGSVLPGCKVVVKKLIPITIVLAGAKLNLIDLAGVGATAAVGHRCFADLRGCGRLLRRAMVWFGAQGRDAPGAGTGICGNNAHRCGRAVDRRRRRRRRPVRRNREPRRAEAHARLAGAGKLPGPEQRSLGVWAGVSIHAVPQVVAAAFAYSPEAGTLATLVKLVRVTLLAPLIFVLAIVFARQHPSGVGAPRPARDRSLLPPDPLVRVGVPGAGGDEHAGHVANAGVPTGKPVGRIPTPVSVPLNSFLSDVGSFILTITMAAIGLELSLRQLVGVGFRTIAARCGGLRWPSAWEACCSSVF